MLEKYYAEHSEMEQRRSSIIKQLAGAQLHGNHYPARYKKQNVEENQNGIKTLRLRY